MTVGREGAFPLPLGTMAEMIERLEPGLLNEIAGVVRLSAQHAAALRAHLRIIGSIRAAGFRDGTFLDDVYDGTYPNQGVLLAPPPPMPAPPSVPLRAPPAGVTAEVASPRSDTTDESSSMASTQRSGEVAHVTSAARAKSKTKTKPKTKVTAKGFSQSEWSEESLAEIQSNPVHLAAQAEELNRLSNSPRSRQARATAREESKAAAAEGLCPSGADGAVDTAAQAKELKRLAKNFRARQARAAQRQAKSEGVAAGAPTSSPSPKVTASTKRKRQCRQCRCWVAADGDGSTCSCWDPVPDSDPPATRSRRK